MNSAKVWQLVVVSPREITRVGICTVLRETPDLHVLYSGASLWEVPDWQSDLVLIDVANQVWDRLPELRQARAGFLGVRCVIMLSDLTQMVQTTLSREGFCHCLADCVTPSELVGNLRQLLGRDTAAGQQRPSGAMDGLTQRELEVLEAVACGLSNKLIGQRLGITSHTVNAHLKTIYAKLHVFNRMEAVAAWRGW